MREIRGSQKNIDRSLVYLNDCRYFFCRNKEVWNTLVCLTDKNKKEPQEQGSENLSTQEFAYANDCVANFPETKLLGILFCFYWRVLSLIAGPILLATTTFLIYCPFAEAGFALIMAPINVS